MGGGGVMPRVSRLGLRTRLQGLQKWLPEAMQASLPENALPILYFRHSSAEVLEAHTNLSAIYSHLGTGMSHCCKDSADKLKPVS
jgi:hypothetical protein